MSRKPLCLNETFQHFNSLIWQTPAWSVAIAAGVIVAADQIDGKGLTWGVDLTVMRALVLAVGFLLCAGLAAALYRWRGYQAACVPVDPPSPPFRRWPPADTILQFAACITAGVVLGLTAAQVFIPRNALIAGLITGVLFFVASEVAHRRVVTALEKTEVPTLRHEAEEGAMSTPLSTDEAGYLEGYASFAKTLRTWLVAYGVGGPALIATQKTVAERLAASGYARLVVFLFLGGAVLQVVTALLFKAAMWSLYMAERKAELRGSTWHSRWKKLSETLLLEIAIDCLSIGLFTVATYFLLIALL